MPGRDDWAVHVSRCGSGPDQIRTVPSPIRGRRASWAVGVSCAATAASPPQVGTGPIRIAASANRPPAVLWRLRDKLDIEFIRIGSAGAKAMAVVRGDADAYIHAGGQWNGIPRPRRRGSGRGLHATRLDGSPLQYNRPDPASA